MALQRRNFRELSLAGILRRRPQAAAQMYGGREYPDISGSVRFYATVFGTVVLAEIYGLPRGKDCDERVFGFHIHEGKSCSGTESDPFSDTLSHYNPAQCPHPYHAGDMPPLFECGGSAVLLFLTDRFAVSDIIGRTVVIHDSPDDFTTQPSGASGVKIACGVVRRAGGLKI